MITVNLTGKIVAIMAIISFICLGALFIHYKNITNKIIADQDRKIKNIRKMFDDLCKARENTRKEFDKMVKLARETNNFNEVLIAKNLILEKENETLKSELQAKKTEDLIY